MNKVLVYEKWVQIEVPLTREPTKKEIELLEDEDVCIFDMDTLLDFSNEEEVEEDNSVGWHEVNKPYIKLI